MKLLLDENLPKRLKQDFVRYDVFTVADMGWTGTTNGALLQRMLLHGFDVFITFDKNLKHQQNFKKYTVFVIVLSAPNNTYSILKKLIPSIVCRLEEPIKPGVWEIKYS